MKSTIQVSAFSLLALLGVNAQAALVSSATSNTFNLTASKTDTNLTATATSSSNVTPSGTAPSLAKFNDANGVLTGVTFSLNSNRTQTVSGSATKGMGPGFTANFAGSSTASLAAPGVTTQNFNAAISASTSCSLSMGPSGSCTAAAGTSGAVATNASSLSVAAVNLNSYATTGSGNVSGIALTLPTISANISPQSGYTLTGTSASTSLAWTGTVSASYSYLLHALASFDGGSSANALTLDFGTVAQNSIASLNFGLFNLANADRTGLDLDGFAGSGDTSAFSTDLSVFSNLAQSGNQGFIANLLTSNVGAFSAQYIINLSDADIGASSTWKNQTLTLNLVGNVTAVPVPSAVWLFGSALLGFLGVSRRKTAVSLS